MSVSGAISELVCDMSQVNLLLLMFWEKIMGFYEEQCVFKSIKLSVSEVAGNLNLIDKKTEETHN